MFFSTLFFGKNLPGELIPVAVQTEVNFNDVNLESILLPAFPDTLIVPGRDFDFNSEQSNQNLNLDQLRSGGISPSIDNNIPGERGSFQPSAPFSGELQDFGGSTFNFSPSTGQAPLSDPLRSYEANYDYSKKFSIDSPTGVGMDFAPLSPNELVSQLGTNENFTPLGTFDFSNISFVSGRGRRSLRRDSSRRLEEQQDLVVSEDAALLAPAPAIIAPRGLDDIYVTFRDLALNTLPGNGVLSNDIAGSGGVVRSNLINYPGGGALTLNPDGSFSYTPPAGFAGRETFTYELTNGTQTSGPVTVTLDVIVPNIAPVALGNTYSINEDNTLNVPVNGVLGNDLDPDGPNPLSAQLVSGPANGSLTLNADGSFSYTPNANYAGGDSFTYRASDGVALSNVATVNITVNAQNDPPVTQNDTYSVNEDTTLNVAASGVLSNDSDPEGDALSAVLVSGPSNGSLTLNGNGSFSYTPNANFFGSDSFTYRANDGSVDSGVATANITVNAQNDPPVAFNNAYSVDENNVLSVGIVPGVLTNDGDLEGDPLSAILVSGPANGSLTLNSRP